MVPLSLPSDLEDFREEVRRFLAERWRPHPKEDLDYVKAFRRAATERGYLYRSVPKAYGGSEQPADPLRAEVIRQAFDEARAPREIPGQGVSMVTPTLLEWGADWQKSFFIPPTLAGEITWAQGYSEPGAGSDLASLTTRAELVGGEWVIRGHKIWTSHAWRADYLFMLARTEPDAPRHAGISYLLVNPKQPGVEIRRIRQISGQSDFCEVFFDDARTPADWIVGERGQGWQVSRSTLKHERNMVGSAESSRELFNKLVALARSTQSEGRPAIEDPVIRDRLAALEGAVEAHLASSYHQLLSTAQGKEPGLLATMNKLIASNLAELAAGIAGELLGPDLMLAPSPQARGRERWLQQILGSLALTIAGGTSNIQRNVIAERGLGLPRDTAG